MFIEPYYRIQMPMVVDQDGIELWVYYVTDGFRPVRLYCTDSGDEWYISNAEFNMLLENADIYDKTFHVNLSLINAA